MKRNPFAKAVTRIRPQVIPGVRRRTDRQRDKRDIRRELTQEIVGSSPSHKRAKASSTLAPATS